MPDSTFPPAPFPPAFRFADADPAELEAEAPRPLLPHATPLPAGAWNLYLARLLPPVRADLPRGAGAPAPLHTHAGMADFLVGFGPGPAHAVARGLDLMDRSGFWREVEQELAALAPQGS